VYWLVGCKVGGVGQPPPVDVVQLLLRHCPGQGRGSSIARHLPLGMRQVRVDAERADGLSPADLCPGCQPEMFQLGMASRACISR